MAKPSVPGEGLPRILRGEHPMDPAKVHVPLMYREPKPEVLKVQRKKGDNLEVRATHNGFMSIKSPEQVEAELLLQEFEKKRPADLAYLRSQHLQIGTPCYGNALYLPYVQSLKRLVLTFHVLGISLTTTFVGTESLITRARNGIAAEFVGSSATLLLFIDADIGSWTPMDVMDMMLCKREVLSAVYPLKRLNIKEMLDMAVKHTRENPDAPPLDPEQVMRATNSYVFNGVPTADVQDDGALKVLDVATGFLMINRKVMKMLEHVCDPYVNDMATYDTPNSKGKFRNYFPTLIDPDSGRFLSEDYAFSRLCQKVGIDVYVLPRVRLSHSGQFTWEGALGEHLLQRVEPERRENIAKILQLSKPRVPSGLTMHKAPPPDPEATAQKAAKGAGATTTTKKKRGKKKK